MREDILYKIIEQLMVMIKYVGVLSAIGFWTVKVINFLTKDMEKEPKK